jgi:hypothetical protein
LLAVAQDGAGRLIPICGWILRRSRSIISEVVDRIRTEHAFTPRRDRSGGAWMDLGGPADFVGLYHELEEATLFAPERAWRIRPPAEHERIVFETPGRCGATTVLRFIDLPDGTFIGRADIRGASVFVRARADRLDSPPEDESIRLHGRRSNQPANEVVLLCGRLAEILSAPPARRAAASSLLDLPRPVRICAWARRSVSGCSSWWRGRQWGLARRRPIRR